MASVLTTVGKGWIVDKLDETVQTTADYLAWGTGSTASSIADTALSVEAAETRVTATRTQPAADTIQWVGTLTSLSAQSITNAGNFDALTAGVLVVHGDITSTLLAIGDKIEFTITVQIT